MCLICIEFEKRRMTVREARRAYTEMVEGMTQKHAAEVSQMLDQAEATEDDSANP